MMPGWLIGGEGGVSGRENFLERRLLERMGERDSCMCIRVMMMMMAGRIDDGAVGGETR